MNNIIFKRALLILFTIISLLICSNGNDTENVKTLNGKFPEKYIKTFQPIENTTNHENSKCINYYENLFLVSSTTSDSNEIWKKIPNGYNLLFKTDLNEGSKGRYIYLAASFKCNVTNPIGVLTVTTSRSCLNYDQWEYIPNSEGMSCPGLDLNMGSGGEYIFLYLKKGTSRPIQQIGFLVSTKNDPSWPGYFVHPLDLNKGSGGKYIWIAWKY